MNETDRGPGTHHAIAPRQRVRVLTVQIAVDADRDDVDDGVSAVLSEAVENAIRSGGADGSCVVLDWRYVGEPDLAPVVVAPDAPREGEVFDLDPAAVRLHRLLLVHKHGEDVDLCLSEAAAKSALARWCSENADDRGDRSLAREAFLALPDDERVEAYFHEHPSESYSIEQIDVQDADGNRCAVAACRAVSEA